MIQTLFVMFAISLPCADAATSPVQTPTWGDPIRAIMQQHCVSCHHDRGAAPFALQTYEQVARRADFVAAVTSEGLMPPWPPSDQGLALADHRGLSAAERSAIKAWANAGMPIGDDKSPAVIPSAESIRHDMVLSMNEAWPMPAESRENWGRRDTDKWTFVLPLDNAEGLQVQAIEHVTAVPTAMHAISYLTDHTNLPQWQDARTEGPGHYMAGDVYDAPTGLMGTTGVGGRVRRLPDGYHWPVRARSSLIMQSHYRPTGKAEQVQDTVILELSADEDSRPVRVINLMKRFIDLPIGGVEVFRDSLTIPETVELVGMTPRVMGICTSLQVTADIPGEGLIVLLDIPDYDPHWRMMFQLDSPYELPAGTLLTAQWTIENTEENERNPFVPLDRLAMAKRTGSLSILLHVAAEDAVADQSLTEWHVLEMLSRLRRPVP